jgi:hypothetical protein
MTQGLADANTRAVSELAPLLGEIAELLELPEEHDDPERLERTLTDGYAQALTLEAERSSLQQRVRELTPMLGRKGGSSTREVSALARRLDSCDVSFELLRGELVRLQRRHSLAVRARRTWACGSGSCQTSPERTA